MGCSVRYGDTDSVYLSVPEHHFAKADIQYYTGRMSKLDYWTELVDITFREIPQIKQAVNNWFVEDNGTNFLRMAFEEALYPCVFLAKKKYYGIAHISIANFQPKGLFIRGLEVVKRGISEFLRKACMSIMWRSVQLDNTRSLLELAHMKVKEVYSNEWDFSDFVKTAVYKPNKQNVAVQTFAARMKVRGVDVKPHERFRYIIAKKYPKHFDSHRGCGKALSVGDRMEYAEYAREANIPIDKDYYVTGGLIGQLSRLIVYHPQFFHEAGEPGATEDPDDEDIKAAELKIFNSAKKYMKAYCSQFFTVYAKKGKAYQKIFKISNKVIRTALTAHVDDSVAELMTSNYDLDAIEEWISKMAEKAATKSLKNHGKNYVTRKMDKCQDVAAKRAELRRLNTKYFSGDNPVENRREREFSQEYTRIMADLASIVDSMKLIFSSHTAMVHRVSDVIKKRTMIDELYNAAGDVMPAVSDIPGFADAAESDDLAVAADAEVLRLVASTSFVRATAKLKEIYARALGAFTKIVRVRMIVNYLKFMRNRSNGIFSQATDEQKEMIAEMVNGTVG